MKSEKKLSPREKMYLHTMNSQWCREQWKEFCEENDYGLVIEDGKVTRWEREHVVYVL